MNKALLAACLAGAASLALAQQPTKIGIFNFQQAIIATKDGQKAATDLQARFDPKKKSLEAMQGSIAALQQELAKGSNTMAEAKRTQITRDIDQKTKELQRASEDAQQKKAEADQAAASSQTQPEPAVEQQKRKIGGREPLPEGGYFSAIAGARRHVMNKVDDIAWIQGVRSFKAEEGRKPKDAAEFMNVVVTKYELQLPAIEADEEYLYDPDGVTDGDFGQLYVVKKAGAAESPAPAPTP